MLDSFQKASAWDLPENKLSPEQKIYISDPTVYEDCSTQAFDIEKLGAMQHQAAWSDVVQKAKQIRTNGGILWFDKKPHNPSQPNGVVKVEGTIQVTPDLSTFGTYQNYLCQIYFPHRLSRSCFGWACQCRWHDFVWTRRKYYGRFCSHALALYQASASADINFQDVPEEVFNEYLPLMIEENILSPEQLRGQLARARRRLSPSEFMDQEDLVKFEQNLKKIFQESEEYEPEDYSRESELGENFENILKPWQEEIWGEGGEPPLSRHDNQRTRRLRNRIKTEKQSFDSAVEDLEQIDKWIKDQQQKRVTVRQFKQALEKNNSLPLEERRDAKEIYAEFGLSDYIGKGVQQAFDDINENVRILRNQKSNQELRVNQAISSVESLKKELQSALQESKKIKESDLSNDDILDMIDQIRLQGSPNRANKFLDRFEKGTASGGGRQYFVEMLRKEYASLAREEEMLKRRRNEIQESVVSEEEIDRNGTKYIKRVVVRQKFDPDNNPIGDPTETTYYTPLCPNCRSELGKDDLAAEKCNNCGYEIAPAQNPTDAKQSKIFIISSNQNIKDVVLYVQDELVNGEKVFGYINREVFGELRGGLCPHPDAFPASVNEKNLCYTYSPNDLGYDPETTKMNSNKEERGSWGLIPVGEEVEIVSIDPKSRMALVRYFLGVSRPNHTHIDVWLPIKEIDLI